MKVLWSVWFKDFYKKWIENPQVAIRAMEVLNGEMGVVVCRTDVYDERVNIK